MITVRLAAALRPYAGGEACVELEAGSVGDVLRALDRAHPGVGRRVVDEQGRIRTHVNVFIGQDKAAIGDVVPDGAEVSILAAASGG